MTFRNEDNKILEDLSDGEKLALVEALENGKLEYFSTFKAEWCQTDILNAEDIHRVVSKELIIPWNLFEDKWKYATVSPYGSILFWTEIPEYDEQRGWLAVYDTTVSFRASDGLLKIDTDGIDYKTEVAVRPEGV